MMNRKSILVIILATWHFTAIAKRLLEDRGLYVVQDKAYFLSDFKSMIADLNKFRCLFKKSEVVGPFQLSAKRIRSWDKININSLQSKAGRAKVLEVLPWLKLIHYIEGQKVVMSPNLMSTLKRVASANGCNVQFPLSENLYRFVRSEIYFRSRFDLKTFWVTLDDQKQNKGQIEAEKRKKRSESIQAFKEALTKQVPHQIL